ncbi:MmyB family transcriptional regulator [Nocardia fluminea]|uniref:Helix-turn-helix protein n=1 Tax=Nocardia fluminea TaxID=134984 RepID=A0A2N3VFT6_9NOCA|nr:helix-turn-helix domain-containing protein [Nocardia fluminea]PKV80490.1 helix-turn-helix protein [Nocardia fluminea]
MNRRTNPTNHPRRGQGRTEPELPDLGRWLRRVREHRELSRPEAAGLLKISYELLRKIEYGTAPCTVAGLEQMITTYNMNPAQARHSRDLVRVPVSLDSVEELRTRPSAADHLETLSNLDERGLVGAYIDPLWSLVHANKRFRFELPGIGYYDDNVSLWFFHPGTTAHTAESLVVDWDIAAAYLVASLRAAFGVYRQTPHAQALFEKLCGSVVFTELWNTRLGVAYGYQTEEPLRLREPDTGELYCVRIHLGAKGYTHLGTNDTPDLRFCMGYRDPCDPPIQL